MSIEWKTYRLGDIGKIVTGKTPKTAIAENYGGDIPFLTPSDDLSSKFAPQTIKTLTQRGLSEVKNCLLPTNAICVSCIGSDLGKVVKVTIPTVTNQQFNSVIPNEDFDPDFVYYLMTIVGKELNYLSKTSTAVPIVNKTQFSSFEFKAPSLAEQRRIAGILGAIDDKIENNRRINTNLELQAQALYKQWFVDFEFPNENGKPYKSSGGKMVDSELGPIPDGWSVGDIYKYVNVVYGAPYKSALFNERKDGNPLIRIRDLKTFSPQYYTQEILPNTEYVNAGDVVAGMDAEFVPCLWMGKKGVLNQRCCKFVGKQDSISNYYVMFLVKPELEFVQSYKTGTTVSHLGKADIDKFIVVQPPMTVIEKFSKIADALLNNKIKLAKENITLATLRDTLLPKLMNGEIKL